ncbi:MAG: zinc-binding dehydrogenase [Candidatus Bathyarchaeota archaeon]|nr:zinc-binding dehydrogenase [Candidatus Bathyarchaeota archaeon]
MKAIFKAEPKPGVEVRDVPVPKVMDGYSLLKVKACGICGSDVHIYEWTPGYDVMIPYMPLILGHEFSGEVVEVGEGETELREGDRVLAGPSRNRRGRSGRALRRERPPLTGPFAGAAMAEYVLVSSDRLWKLPENVSYDVGAMCEPLAVAMNAVLLSKILPGERAVVLGPGPIGLLTLLGLKAAGVYVFMTGKAADEKRLKLAKRLGADVILNVDEVDPVSTILKSTGGRGADVVYEATGVPATIQEGLNMVRRGGKVVAIGIHSSPASINMLDLVRGAKQILGSYSGPTSVWTRELALLARGLISLEPLVSHRLPLRKATRGFELALSKEGVKILFTP